MTMEEDIGKEREQQHEQQQSERCPYTIVPIEGMEAMQKNFASYGQDGDAAAEQFLQEKKLTLSRRFTLFQRGYTLQLKEEEVRERKTMFDRVHVQLVLGHHQNSSNNDDSNKENNKSQKQDGQKEKDSEAAV